MAKFWGRIVAAGLIVVYTLYTNTYVTTSGREAERLKPPHYITDVFTYHSDHDEVFEEETALKFARNLTKHGKAVLITVINEAFLPLAHSWLCNTMLMGIHHQVLFIVPDMTSKEELRRKWPEVHVVKVSTSGSFTGSLEYTTAEYVRLMVFRTKMLNWLLKNKVNIFLFEVDAVWFSNPLHDIMDRLKDGGDIAAVMVTQSVEYAGGILYLKPTNETVRLWSDLTNKMDLLGKNILKVSKDRTISEQDNDQIYLSQLLVRDKNRMKIVQLPNDIYADGRWYLTRKRIERPILINNNFVIGRERKIRRAKTFKHWFWDDHLQTCNLVLVKETFRIAS